MSDFRAYKDGLPGSRRSPCLGCDQPVVTARDPHVTIIGKRDGSLLLLNDARPQISMATDIERIFTEPDLEVLGLAHRDCVPVARERLEAGEAELPDFHVRAVVETVADDEAPELPALHAPPTPGTCPFCGREETTEEHVWAKWIGRTLEQSGVRLKRSLEVTVPSCDTCNHRWLSVLENDVVPILRPMILGEERRLSPDEQCLLATWAVKTAVMIELSVDAPLIPTGFYYDLRQRRSALPSNIVWIGAYCGSRRAAVATRTALHIEIDPEEPPNAVVTTFTAFRVVFQVLTHFAIGPLVFREGRPLAPALGPIWPPNDEPIDWPPNKFAFGDESLLELAGSIADPEDAS